MKAHTAWFQFNPSIRFSFTLLQSLSHNPSFKGLLSKSSGNSEHTKERRAGEVEWRERISRDNASMVIVSPFIFFQFFLCVCQICRFSFSSLELCLVCANSVYRKIDMTIAEFSICFIKLQLDSLVFLSQPLNSK